MTGPSSNPRPRLDDLTDDQLDQLYAELWHLRLDKEGAGLALAAAVRKTEEERRRAEKAEAELAVSREVARSNRRHVQAIVPELEKAEAAIARVRAELAALEAELYPVADDGIVHATRRIRAALDGTT